MRFVTYAQNLEDVMLWRALHDQPGGFYIDVGAADPVDYSVTKAFYDAGWCGINIEPVPHSHQRLEAVRRLDVNLPVVLGGQSGERPFHELPDTGLSTVDRQRSERLSGEAATPVRRYTVPCLTLAQVCQLYAPPAIHFLKIDVEGAEAEVLRGADFSRWRPWIIVVEALDSCSRQPNHDEWEPLLLHHDYRFVYHDGLNRFYLAAEHAELAPRFDAPPNLWDDYLDRMYLDLAAGVQVHLYALAHLEYQVALTSAPRAPAWRRVVTRIRHALSRRWLPRAIPVEASPRWYLAADTPVADHPVSQRLHHALCRALGGRPMTAAWRVWLATDTDPAAAGPAEPSTLRLLVITGAAAPGADAGMAHINQRFDAVLATSPALCKRLRDAGCALPIHPVDSAALLADPAAPEPQTHGDRPYTLLYPVTDPERDATEPLLTAWARAFSGDEPIHLHLYPLDRQASQRLQSWLQARPERVPPNVDCALVESAPPPADALIAPEDATTWPLGPTAVGHLPRVTVGPLPSSADPCATQMVALRWVARLRRLLDDPASRPVAPPRPSLPAAVDAIDRFIQRLADDTAAPQRPLAVALVSPWATRCGIAEYAGQLFADPPSEQWRLRIYCDQRTTSAERPAHAGSQPVWRLGDTRSLLDVLIPLHGQEDDLILVQHQPSLFDLAHAIPLQLAALRSPRRAVVLELHSTRPLLGEYAPSPQAIDALRQLDRIIVHGPADVDHLLRLGLQDNVTIMPLSAPPEWQGHPAPVRPLGVEPDALLLGSFGFLLPHKGVDTLIRAIQPLQQALGRPVHLSALHAVLDSRSEAVYNECRALVERLGVAEHVHWLRDYAPLAEVQARLAATDYIVYPYRATLESASAAAVVGITAQRPVLVTPRPLFADLVDCVTTLAGDQVDHIVAAIVQLEQAPERVQAQLARQRDWLAARSAERIRPRYLNLLRGLCRDRRHA